MKATDLMIGDWVLKDLNYDSDYEFDNVNYRQYQIRDGEDIDLASETNMLATDSIYKPIPLTSEILEKNGFKEVEKNLFHLGQSSIGVDTWLGIDNNVIYVDALYHDGEIAFCKCDYVHELQHALKLCGIEKEITL